MAFLTRHMPGSPRHGEPKGPDRHGKDDKHHDHCKPRKPKHCEHHHQPKRKKRCH